MKVIIYFRFSYIRLNAQRLRLKIFIIVLVTFITSFLILFNTFIIVFTIPLIALYTSLNVLKINSTGYLSILLYRNARTLIIHLAISLKNLYVW